MESANLSDTFLAPHGVPQGSALSPTLFNINLTPLAQIVQEFGLAIVSYADDTQLVVSVLEEMNSNHLQLVPCLEKIAIWMANSN